MYTFTPSHHIHSGVGSPNQTRQSDHALPKDNRFFDVQITRIDHKAEISLSYQALARLTQLTISSHHTNSVARPTH